MEIVTIGKAEYNNLRKDAMILEHLRALGVDNWDGYSMPICNYCDETKPEMDLLTSPYSSWEEVYVCSDCLDRYNEETGNDE